MPNWIGIGPSGSRIVNNLEMRIPLSRLNHSRLDEYKLWIRIYTSDSPNYDVSPPNSTEGFVAMQGSTSIDSEVIKFRDPR